MQMKKGWKLQVVCKIHSLRILIHNVDEILVSFISIQSHTKLGICKTLESEITPHFFITTKISIHMSKQSKYLLSGVQKFFMTLSAYSYFLHSNLESVTWSTEFPEPLQNWWYLWQMSPHVWKNLNFYLPIDFDLCSYENRITHTIKVSPFRCMNIDAHILFAICCVNG